MTQLATVLRDEVRRLARKEVRAQTESLRQSASRHRHEIAELKRQLKEQRKAISLLETRERRRRDHSAAAVSHAGSNGVTRFSARSVRSQRQRTGLSAADYGSLVGVSGVTIYNWEQGKSRPRPAQLEALVALRGIGKREAQARLKSVNGRG